MKAHCILQIEKKYLSSEHENLHTLENPARKQKTDCAEICV
jgi:hypothetical protein